MIGGKFNVKKSKTFMNTMQKIPMENSLLFPRNRQKSEVISLNYDVNDHAYSVKIHITSYGISQYRIFMDFFH